jgi:DNA-binding MarR family transcriptional regulator
MTNSSPSRLAGQPYTEGNINEQIFSDLVQIKRTMLSLYEGPGSQQSILIVLSEQEGPISQQTLIKMLGIAAGSASEVLAKLEHAGLIERTVYENDRRSALVSLTSLGEQKAKEAYQTRKERHEAMFACLDENQKEQLLSLLDTVCADWSQRFHKGNQRKGKKHGKE